VSYFEVVMQSERGAYIYRQGANEHLGSVLGHQVAETLDEDSDWVIIGFDRGAKIKLAKRNVLSITES
jgi:hypothetical protein